MGLKWAGGRWRHGLVLAIVGLWGAMAPGTGQAQDWSLSSDLTQRMTYNSNLLLNPDHKISTFGSLTIPHLTLERDGPTSNVSLDGKFKFAEYFGHSELNSDGQNLALQASKDLSERSTAAFHGEFNRDTTVTSEADIDDRFLDRAIRYIYWNVSPTYTYLLSPIDQISITGAYQNKNYDSVEKTDFEYYGGYLNYSHSLSETSQITGSLSYFRYVPDIPTDLTTDIYGGLIGYKYTPSERLLVSGGVGLNYNVTHEDDATGERNVSEDVGYRFNFELDYDLGERTKVNLTLSHDTEPSGDGRQVTRSRGGLGLDYRLGEMTTFSLDATYSDNQDYLGEGSNTDGSDNVSRYYSLKPALTWDITEDLSLAASYQFRYKKFESRGGSAVDNGVFLSLRYALPDQHWSGF
jgi:hypothetical protein